MTVTATEKVLLTAEDFWQLPSDGQKYELVAGELFQMPLSGFLHGTIAMVYYPNGEIKILREGEELQGKDVLPGFVCQIKQIFA